MPAVDYVWQVPVDHPAFAGHFPGRPIVPGVVLLDQAIRFAETTLGHPIARWQIGNAKFQSPVGPGEVLTFTLDPKANGALTFTVRAGERAVASGSLAPAPAVRGEKPGDADWLRQQEKSNLAILRLMVWISLTFGRRIARIVLYGIAIYYVLFAPRARRYSRDYLRRALGRWAGWTDGFRHVLSFASTILDRIYLLNGRFDLFDIEVVGSEALYAALAQAARRPVVWRASRQFRSAARGRSLPGRSQGCHADGRGERP